MRPRNSIRQKLFFAIFGSVLVGLLVASTLAVWMDAERYAANKTRELQTIGSIFASATATAAASRNSALAREALRAIGQVPGMLHARIRLPDGSTLTELGIAAQLATDPKIRTAEQLTVWQALTSQSVEVGVPITESGESVGELILVGDTADFATSLKSTVRGTAICALIALLLGLAVAARLQLGITEPLQKLLSAMQQIRSTHNYGARIEIRSNDEIGRLVEGFNQTFGEIGKRDRALERLAYYDPLTGLGNRALFQHNLDELFSRSGSNACGAVLLLDLDAFKDVNEALGHAGGDAFLVKIANVLSCILPSGHQLARLAGDEFAIMVPGAVEPPIVERITANLIDIVSTPVAIEGNEVSVETSIGIALFPQDGLSAADLLRKADLALYAAKERGRARYEFYKPAMLSNIEDKISLARDLRHALAENVGLCLHYQPQIELASGRVTGFEALMRWNHPTLGNVPPSRFIPVAESSRLICEVGTWALRQAAAQAKAWLDAGEPPREIAVNMSAAQIWHADVPREVASVLSQTKLPAHLLCIELTESLLAENADGRVSRVLQELKDLGVTLALDDFGTDYSSLGSLQQLPFDKLKIDRVFVAGADRSSRTHELLKGIVALGRGLGMTVVAEGAETDGEANTLRELCCHQAQGYAFARPVSAPEALVTARRLEAGRKVTHLPGIGALPIALLSMGASGDVNVDQHSSDLGYAS